MCRFPASICWFFLILLTGGLLIGCGSAAEPEPQTANPIAEPSVTANSAEEAGRYLVVVGGCNDCHTAGYLQTEGNMPESEWLAGSPVGFKGPWGTTYPKNLRLTVQNVSEDEWVEMLHTRKAMPPMPWMNINQVSDKDARALYRYIKSLGPKGEPTPKNLPPGEEPSTPYINFVPQNLPEPPKG